RSRLTSPRLLIAGPAPACRPRLAASLQAPAACPPWSWCLQPGSRPRDRRAHRPLITREPWDGRYRLRFLRDRPCRPARYLNPPGEAMRVSTMHTVKITLAAFAAALALAACGGGSSGSG